MWTVRVVYPAGMTRGEVDIVYYYVCISHPAGMVLSGRFIGLMYSEHSVLHVFLSVFCNAIVCFYSYSVLFSFCSSSPCVGCYIAGGLLKPLQTTLDVYFGREPKWLYCT